MTNKEDWNLFLDGLLTRAVEEFRATEPYGLLKEKLDQMDLDCDMMLKSEEKEFATECFELLLQVSGQQEEYIYRKGLQDSVFILKNLGVLS